MTSSDLIANLRAELPPIFARRAVGRLLGDVIAPGTLANLDSQGNGPAGLHYLGTRACYEREPFLAWLEVRLAREPKTSPATAGRRSGTAA